MKGLVLAGGESRRFGSDKAKALWPATGETLAERAYKVLQKTTSEVWVACRRSQGITFTDKLLFDADEAARGPGAAFASAHRQDPESPWFVLACDMTEVDSECVEYLIGIWNRNPSLTGVLFKTESSERKDLVQPLLGIWTPAAFSNFLRNPGFSPQAIARSCGALGIACPQPKWLRNQNLPNLSSDKI